MRTYQDCPACRCLVAAQAPACPFCGADLRSGGVPAWLLGLVLCLGVPMASCSEKEQTTETQPYYPDGVTYAGPDEGSSITDSGPVDDGSTTAAPEASSDASTYAGPDETASTGDASTTAGSTDTGDASTTAGSTDTGTGEASTSSSSDSSTGDASSDSSSGEAGSSGD